MSKNPRVLAIAMLAVGLFVGFGADEVYRRLVERQSKGVLNRKMYCNALGAEYAKTASASPSVLYSVVQVDYSKSRNSCIVQYIVTDFGGSGKPDLRSLLIIDLSTQEKLDYVPCDKDQYCAGVMKESQQKFSKLVAPR